MTKKTKLIIGAVGVGIATFLALLLVGNVAKPLGGQGGVGANSCTISTQAAVGINPSTSVEVVAAHANNAWVRIAQPQNATNTVAIGFGQDAAFGSGVNIYATSSLDLGLNTDFPFTGAVEAKTSTGSSTVQVTVCRY